MIKYKIDILDALKNNGYSSYRIRNDKILNEATLQKLRSGKYINMENLDKLCILLDCQPGDLLEFVSDTKE